MRIFSHIKRTLVLSLIISTGFGLHAETKPSLTRYRNSFRAAALTPPRNADEAAIVPPYFTDFSNGLAGWTIIDANNDGETWSKGNNTAKCSFSMDGPMDDWLITPAIRLEAGASYDMTFDARGSGKWWPERMEIKYGKGPSAADMTDVILEPTIIGNETFETYSTRFAPQSDGIYYIGFHCISDPDMFKLEITNINISAGVSAAVPGTVTDLTATPATGGELKCTVAFTTPATAIDGGPLASLTKVDVMRDGDIIKSFDAPAVNTRLEFTDTPTTGGEKTYSVVAYNASGNGPEASVTALVGFDIPEPLAAAWIARTETEGEALVCWEPVTRDIKGNSMTEEDVRYVIYRQGPTGWTPLADNIKGTSYTYQAVAPGDQDFVEVIVYPYTTAGSGDGMITDMVALGTPYTQLHESFADVSLSYIWGYRERGGAELLIHNDSDYIGRSSQDHDNGYLAVLAETAYTGVDFFSGMISLINNPHPLLSLYTVNMGDNGLDDANLISVYAREIGTDNWAEVMAPTAVADICRRQPYVWGQAQIPLDDFAGKVIEFQISTDGVKYIYTMIDNIQLQGVKGNDLSACIKASNLVNTGTHYPVTVEVTNNGASTADAYTVELYSDNQLVASAQRTALDRQATDTIEFEAYMPAMADYAVTLEARVVYPEDEETADNSATMSVRPHDQNLPVATDLTGKRSDATVNLSWERPALENMRAEQITESFEEADGFSADYPGWTFVDLDSQPVFIEGRIPGIDNHVSTGSFWIWDNDAIDWNQPVHNAKTGSKYLFAPGTRGKSTDNWAISPELSGESQMLAYWGQSRMYTYPEAVEIYYSTGSVNPAEFIKIDNGSVNPVNAAWTEYYCRLPEGAKRFAIRSCSYDTWAMMIDDVTFTPAHPSSYEIAGYNVYRNGMKLNDQPVEATTFADTTYDSTQPAEYYVTVVYRDRGESRASNLYARTTEIRTTPGSGISIAAEGDRIVIRGAEGLETTLATADGKVIFNGIASATTTVRVSAGVYIVKAGNVTRKLIVR